MIHYDEKSGAPIHLLPLVDNHIQSSNVLFFRATRTSPADAQECKSMDRVLRDLNDGLFTLYMDRLREIVIRGDDKTALRQYSLSEKQVKATHKDFREKIRDTVQKWKARLDKKKKPAGPPTPPAPSSSKGTGDTG